MTTRCALRKLLREYWAGIEQRPPDRSGYRTFAKRNHNRFGLHWIWVQQRINPKETDK